MYIEQRQESCIHYRTSKLGAVHYYVRKRTWVHFRCDSCETEFQRLKKNISPKRLSNNYFHVCSDCDAKRFAQRKGAERRTIWNKRASSLEPVSKL